MGRRPLRAGPAPAARRGHQSGHLPVQRRHLGSHPGAAPAAQERADPQLPHAARAVPPGRKGTVLRAADLRSAAGGAGTGTGHDPGLLQRAQAVPDLAGPARRHGPVVAGASRPGRLQRPPADLGPVTQPPDTPASRGQAAMDLCGQAHQRRPHLRPGAPARLGGHAAQPGGRELHAAHPRAGDRPAADMGTDLDQRAGRRHFGRL